MASKFHKGYKGKGMCGACAYQQGTVANSNLKLCSWYQSTCKQVSRNCPGIRILKDGN